MVKGSFIFVLHSHLPYVRKKGKWPHGEEMLFEAMVETYIPLIQALKELLNEGYHPKLTISLTPILLEQLGDAYLNGEFEKYLAVKIRACENDIKIYSGPKVIKDPEDRKKHQEIAIFYKNFYLRGKKLFEEYGKDLTKTFKELQDDGVLDIITSSATHAYLPLYEQIESIREQIKIGAATYRKYFGMNPTGIWLPECGYRPVIHNSDGTIRFPGFEDLLAEEQIQYFFTDAHVFSNANQIVTKETKLTGPYNFQQIVYEEEMMADIIDGKPTSKPYRVGKSNVKVFARDMTTSLQVWSGEYGYPGDYYYREFHAKDAISGLQYCRITHHGELGGKQLYEPLMAQQKVKEHARHFARLVEERIKTVGEETGENACIVSSYDTELFGHWWFEGVDWLKEVLVQLEISSTVAIDNARSYLQKNTVNEKISIPESSWGLGGKHYVWMNDETKWVWPVIHALAEKMKQASKDFQNPTSQQEIILNQALRELLLLQSSDWPFLITTVQAKDYAIERFLQHQERFEKLIDIVQHDHALSAEEKSFLEMTIDEDNPFSQIDYKMFGEVH